MDREVDWKGDIREKMNLHDTARESANYNGKINWKESNECHKRDIFIC